MSDDIKTQLAFLAAWNRAPDVTAYLRAADEESDIELTDIVATGFAEKDLQQRQGSRWTWVGSAEADPIPLYLIERFH